MNLVKKILIVHGDAKARRRLVLLLADAGFDIRAFSTADSAAESARGEWFNLAIVDHRLPEAPGFAFVDTLKKIQPTVPVLLLVPQLELPLVVKGIRLGVADVLAACEDPRFLLRRVRALLQMEPVGDENEVTPEEIAEVEALLENCGTGGGNSSPPFGTHVQEPSAELLRLSKEKALLESRVERLQHEKTALEAELKTLLGQNADAERLHAELANLNSERELVAVAQATIDEKARALRETRTAIANERSALEDECRRLAANSPPAAPSEEKLAHERAAHADLRQRLEARQEELAEEAARLRQETVQRNQERRRWHDDLDLLRAQEENLRVYEERLRQIQANLEADRVLWFSSNARPVPRSPSANDAALREAWAKLQRASELLEAERNNFRDDRLAIQDHHAAVKRREAQVRDREIQLNLREKKLRELPPAPLPSPIETLTRGPFNLARTVFGSAKKN